MRLKSTSGRFITTIRLQQHIEKLIINICAAGEAKNVIIQLVGELLLCVLGYS